MGKVFYDMGLLSQAKVEECSATDLIGQYVGHTGPKVQKLLEKALGKVLFIDEAYRLAEGGFATEAMDELVDCLTKPKFAGKLITILAGYDKDIDRLMSINPGLTSRFPEVVIFHHLDPATCLELLTKTLVGLQQKKGAPLDLSIIDPPSLDLQERILRLFHELSALESWGNARDVKSLAKDMFGALISQPVTGVINLVLTEAHVTSAMQKMLEERSRRSEAIGTSRFPHSLPLRQQHQSASEQQESPNPLAQETSTESAPTASQPPATAPITTLGTEEETKAPPTGAAKISTELASSPPSSDSLSSILEAKRDPNVPDSIWEQLMRDKHAAVAQEAAYQQLREAQRQQAEHVEELKRLEQATVAAAEEEERRFREAERIAAELEQRDREEAAAAVAEEERCRREAEKKAAELERRRRRRQAEREAAELERRRREAERVAAEIERRRREEELAEAERRRAVEKKVQTKLRVLGLCPMSFHWIKQQGGYRCAGGSHWISDYEVERLGA